MYKTLGVLLAAGLTVASTTASAQSIAGNAASKPMDIAMLEGVETASGRDGDSEQTLIASTLAPGEHLWWLDRQRAGDVAITISLADQTLHVYRGGELVGVSTISSGRSGYETPRGVYTILQKKKRHFSNLYDDAPMPYMQRLTWDGIALHAGRLPGYAASHGCIRLPKSFARTLYGVTGFDTTVIVAETMRSAMLTGERYGLIGDTPPPVVAANHFGALPNGAGTGDLNRAMLARLGPVNR